MAIGIILFIGFLQIGLIRPYYRNSKLRAVTIVANRLEDDLIEQADSSTVQHALSIAVDNNVCAVIYNEQSQRIYLADTLGTGCMLSQYNEDILRGHFVEKNEFSENVTNSQTNQEMVIYGKKIEEKLGTYYLYVNSPLEPIDSIVTFFQNQYMMYTVLVIVIASLIGLYVGK